MHRTTKASYVVVTQLGSCVSTKSACCKTCKTVNDVLFHALTGDFDATDTDGEQGQVCSYHLSLRLLILSVIYVFRQSYLKEM